MMKSKQMRPNRAGWMTATLMTAGLVLGAGRSAVVLAAEPAPATEAKPARPVRALQPGIIDLAGDWQTKIDAVRAPDGAWVPRLQVVVHIPNLAPEDVLMATFKRGRAAIGKPYACKPREILVDHQRNQTTVKHRVDLAYFECLLPKEYAQTKGGAYQVELAYRRTLEGKNESLGALFLDTMVIKQGAQNKQKALQQGVHDGPVGVASVYEEPAGGDDRRKLVRIAEGYLRDQLADRYTDSTYLNLKIRTKNDESKGYRRYDAICFHEGQRIGSRAVSGSSSDNVNYWTFKSKDKQRVKWNDRVFRLNHLRVRHANNRGKPNNNSNWWYLDEHPGSYECKIVADGELRGVARFEVKDGHVLPHACTAQLNAPDHVTLVAFEDKGMSDLPVDRKQQKRIFYGSRSWSGACPPRK